MEERLKRLGLLMYLAVMVYCCWTMIPEHRRKAMLMRLAQQSRNLSQQLAEISGRYGMSLELRGETEAARQSYSIAYQLMTGAHDRAISWYEQLRGTS